MQLWRFVLALVLALGAASSGVVGCAERASYVVLLVDVQPEALAAATLVRVEVAGLDGRVRRNETLALVDVALPLRVPLTPEGGDATRGWIVDVTLLDVGGSVVGRARARGGYSGGVTAETSVCVYAGCELVTCGPCDDLACDTCRASVCASADVDLYAPGSAPRCPSTCMARETTCDDLTDEDCDGRIDCADTDCPCTDASVVPPDAATDGCAPTPEATVAACHDGLDNDCDMSLDCADDGCSTLVETGALCANGGDDDCDELVDCADDGCARERCGERGYRCCGGACEDTWIEEANCGACGITCDPDRICVFVSGEMGRSGGGACRCGSGADCDPGFACESHDMQMVCNCASDMACDPASLPAPNARCHLQGAMHHTYCGY